jgi:hypothetical protein
MAIIKLHGLNCFSVVCNQLSLCCLNNDLALYMIDLKDPDVACRICGQIIQQLSDLMSYFDNKLRV